jgi:hypothetical protein
MRLILLISFFILVGCSSNKLDVNPHIRIAQEIIKQQYNKRVKEVTYENKW